MLNIVRSYARNKYNGNIIHSSSTKKTKKSYIMAAQVCKSPNIGLKSRYTELVSSISRYESFSKFIDI